MKKHHLLILSIIISTISVITSAYLVTSHNKEASNSINIENVDSSQINIQQGNHINEIHKDVNDDTNSLFKDLIPAFVGVGTLILGIIAYIYPRNEK